jgi:hypothetical protein
LDNIIVFGIDGKYKNHVGRKGSSSSDYVKISDVKYDKDRNLIFILDTPTRRILQYDIYGRYQKFISLPCVCFSFLPIEDGCWGVSAFTNKYGLTFIDESLTVKQNYFYSDAPIKLMPSNHFIENEKGEYFLHVQYKDTIYKINGDRLHPFIALNFGQNKNPYNDINSTKFHSFIEKSDYLGRITNVHLYKNQLFFSFSDFHGLNRQETIYHAYIDLNQSKIKPLIYSFNIQHFDVPVSPIPDIINLCNGKLIYQIIPEILPDKALLSLKKYDNNISSDSNPILVIYDLNKI